MSPKKLTEDDKQAILELYRHSPETTSTLADRFGVSSSTVSRLLKTNLSEREYDDLIQQKRLARGNKSESQISLPLENAGPEPTPAILNRGGDKPPLIIRARKRKSSAIASNKEDSDTPFTAFDPEPIAETLPSVFLEARTLAENLVPEVVAEPMGRPILKSALSEALLAAPLNTDLGAIVKDIDDDLEDEDDELEDLDDLEEDDDELDGLEDLDDLEDEDELPEDDDWESRANFLPAFAAGETLQVLPLTSAVFPPTCYLVIDRTSELIVRPLKEFAHLGTIPREEIQQRTLPIFDSHQVARRFSHRNQRVIKVPDSGVLHKTLSHLQAKGITRIFLDGQVYSL